MIEMFAGSGVLSATSATEGIRAVAIDQRSNRHAQKCKCMNFDLATAEGQLEFDTLFRRLLGETEQIVVWMAPPCGTASRARGIPVNAKDPPRPLRSAKFPWGLEGVSFSEKDQAKLDAANKVYAWTLRFLTGLPDHVRWVVENPVGSLMWCLPGFVAIGGRSGVVDVDTTMCNHGGSRDKRTRLRTNAPELSELAGPCSATHPPRYIDSQGGHHLHKPWGLNRTDGWATASEAEYPLEFCTKVLRSLFPQAFAENKKTKTESREEKREQSPRREVTTDTKGLGQRRPEEMVKEETVKTLGVPRPPAPRTDQTKVPETTGSEPTTDAGRPTSGLGQQGWAGRRGAEDIQR